VTWMPAFLMRSFEMQPGAIGTALALIIGFFGGAGTYAAGYLGDRFGKRDLRWNVWIVAILMAVAFPFSISLYLAGNEVLALVVFVYPAFAGAAYIAPALAMTQALVTVRMRAAASAVLLFILNLIGMGLGPQLAGLFSDLYGPSMGAESLRYALLTMSVVWIWAAVHFFLAARTLREDIERARQHGA